MEGVSTSLTMRSLLRTTDFYHYQKFQKKELRMAEGEEGIVKCKQNLPSNPLIRKGFLDRGLLVCWKTDPKIDSISPVVYLQDFSRTDFITF